ncbi:hypothetical protein SAMN05443287_102612 [Micromonospora phaseoli]|uniref:DUF4367 domain-containing protein n=1 Tax=Micromonospora phaseoli TaxID=1144548 RepID=A0A1H6VAQ1_9ACTN|nr:hypothetical protein [Micromonospora phaseoli]PZV93635.1 hypothetical protein CLV64_10994 [Micromonospora phaseoli]GIJ79811.1 hypothetical protein Xph01_42430 [Micromonospora phaseoli]SEJ01638.1 hypothetical protein SAMN05443287_102612 [Micromonospora phaseoli]
MDDLERELRELSLFLDTPAPPEVAAQVRARLTAAPRSRRIAVRRRWRYALAAALAALLVAVLPPGRAAVADAVTGLLRFAGITISTSSAPVPPPGSPSPLPAQRPAALDEAGRLVRFPIRTPAALGPPDQVLVADPDGTGSHRVATLLYHGGTLRLDAFDGRLDPVFFKQAGGSGTEWTQVGGVPAVWIGGPHPVTYVDRDGTVRQESARLAAATLIWEDAGVTYRLECSLTRVEAVEIAASMR